MSNSSTNKKNTKKSMDFLPSYFRTEKNSKFLSSTLDQIISTPKIKRLDGYIGAKSVVNYNPSSDYYIDESNNLRSRYQLEPGLIIKNSQADIQKIFSIDDYINQLKINGLTVNNLNKFINPEIYSYNPPVDWDKFVNFSEYYWIFNGPQSVLVEDVIGQPTTSSYTVTDSEQGNSFIFTPDGLTPNPVLTLYKGNTYVFNVSAESNFYIKSTNNEGIDNLYSAGIVGNGTKQVIFTVPDNAPKNLYYRSDTNQFANGKFVIKRRSEKKAINVEEEILGKQFYTSSNGVKFMNGLKVKFLDNVLPASYRNKEFYVEGVGDKIELVVVADLQTPELPQPLAVSNVNVADEIVDRPSYSNFVNGLKVKFVGNVIPSFYKDKEFFVSGVGVAINLIPADATPAPIAELINAPFDGSNFDQFPFDAFKNIPVVPEYVTINRASKDLNPWTRYNRWFHRSVIEFSQSFNNVDVSLDSSLKAARPIIEFNKNLQLYNFGDTFVGNITLLDVENTDAFSTVEGAEEYYIDGVKLEEGFTVIFTADTDILVRSNIYRVSFAFTDTNTRRINLTPYEISPVEKSTVIINKGYKQAGAQWWFDGGQWVLSQTRTTRNQAPLFDLYDNQQQSFSDNQLDTFSGNKIFGYKIGTGVNDPVLGFPLSYDSLAISATYQFQNYFVTESFFKDITTQIQTINTYKLFYKINNSPVEYKNVWSTLKSYQIPVIQETYVDNSDTVEINSVVSPLLLDDNDISVYINEQEIVDYSIVIQDNKKFVKFSSAIKNYVKLKIRTSQEITDNGFFETPINLTNNPYNSLISNFTYTELFDHVKTMIENSSEFQGVYPGVSNLNEVKNIGDQGTRILLNSTPLIFAQHFLTDADNNIINALSLAADNFNQIKSAIINESISISESTSARDALDLILTKINVNKNISFPYANSDMLAYGENYKVKNINVTDSTNKFYPLSSVFDITINSTKSVLIYLNDILLTYGVDYTFDSLDPYVIIEKSLERNDLITIKEYDSTYGSYIAPTPTKLGLYPKYEPKIYTEDTFVNGAVELLQGHDGSIIKTFGDYRDQILLEFEKRIFNNIKVTHNNDIIDITKVLPGYFRNNTLSLNAINSVVYSNFIKWSETYVLDFEKNTTFDSLNPKTYNYKSVNPQLPGHWKGIFRYYFDTVRPHTHPWEMLGFSLQPEWWETQYGPAPYTSNNLILWKDLEKGYIAAGERAGIDQKYARPNLLNLLPVDENGNLVDIAEWYTSINNTVLSNLDQNWVFGDYGPTEESWRRSSFWPFVVQKLLALFDSTKYLSYAANVGKIIKNIAGQYVYDSSDYISTAKLADQLTTDVNPLGYLQYVLEYGKIRSVNYKETLINELKLSDVNLIYKVGGFISKNKTQVVIDSVSPNTINPGALLPQEDFTIELSSFNPVDIVSISGIIIRKSSQGYIISGYDKFNPYFTIFRPVHLPTDPALSVGGKSESFLLWKSGSYYNQGQLVSYENSFYRVITSHFSKEFDQKNFRKLAVLPTVGGASVQQAVRFEKNVSTVHYGVIYSTIQEVYDVIMGYSKWLESQGFIFDSYNDELQQVVNWTFSSKEFLYWSTQNWAEGTVISISPFADRLKFVKQDFYVNNLLDPRYTYGILGIDGKNLAKNNFTVSREEGSFELKSTGNLGIFFAKLYLVQKEHVLKLNNISIFNDVVYDIENGYKQKRIKLIGFKTDDWNGDYFSPGFLYDSVDIKNWTSFTDYQIGDVVKYSNNFYSATKNIPGSQEFNILDWSYLAQKPEKDLLPNFDYKILQFEDFYSLDIDNIDLSQQNLAQGLIGFNSRNYLSNLILNNVSRYKFYQGFIKEKGTKNALDKISKISINSYKGNIEYNEEWAFRSGIFGGYSSLREVEFPLREQDFKENSQIVFLTNSTSTVVNSNYSYIEKPQLTVFSEDFDLDNIFETKSYNNYGNDFIYPVAGYARLDDITATVVERLELTNIVNNDLIIDGNKIWVCFTDNRDWDIYRYSKTGVNAVTATLDVEAGTILVETDKLHNFAVNDLISLSKFNDDINGIYTVDEIPALNQFVIKTTIPDMSNMFSLSEIFRFDSFRFETFDELASFKNQNKIKDNELVWVDNQEGQWKVFKKINNIDYVSTLTGNLAINDQNFGSTVKLFTNTDYIFVASSEYNDGVNDIGRVFVKQKAGDVVKNITSIGINKNIDTYTNYDGLTLFGNSIEFDSTNNIVFIGSPLVGNIKADVSGSVRYARSTNAVVNSTASGLVKISALNESFTPAREVEKAVLVSQIPQNYAEYGHSIFLTKDLETNKLFVSAPGQDSTGSVFVYNYTVDSSVNVVLTATQVISNPGVDNRFGSKVIGSLNGSYIAISSAGNNDNLGSVYIYEYSGGSYGLYQSITTTATGISSLLSSGSYFAEDIHMSGNGQYLFICGSQVVDYDKGYGKVFVYKKAETQFVLEQIIDNVEGTELNFGYKVSSNYDGSVLLISAKGSNLYSDITFDDGNTFFDSQATEFGTYYQNSGAAYLFNRYAEKFVYVKELFDSAVSNNSNYGESVDIGSSYFIVGSPNNLIINTDKGLACLFVADINGLQSWIPFRSQEQLVDLSKIKTSKLIDTTTEQVVNYVEILDPLKGKIVGIADQEIRYKTIYDPAIYNIGNNSVAIDLYNNWLDQQVGQLWWDLNSVKFVWYEQGELEYRKSVWASVFPGTTIDIYEWVRSEFSPSQWAELADTTEGLSLGISGQPKYADDSNLSLGQYYDPVSQTYKDVYYYWVRNSRLVPNKSNRKLSSFEVSQLILNPKNNGIEYLSVLNKNSVSLTNIKPKLKENLINFNIIFDKLSNPLEKHSEWILIEQGSPYSQPTAFLEKKLIDSLLGRDQLGNIVPDPTLPERMKYGIEIRPRQSMFKDQISALRNLIDYSNEVLLKYPFTLLKTFDLLLSQDPIPDPYLGTYDSLISTEILLDQVNIFSYVPAQLVGNVNTATGVISSITITDGGAGYGKIVPIEYENIGPVINEVKVPTKWIGPSITVENNPTASFRTIVDSTGTIVDIEILDPGQAYSSTSTVSITVRPFTVIVSNDTSSGGRWSKYIRANNQWNKISVQKFNTTLYWSYVDWKDPSYNELQPYFVTLNDIYDLSTVTPAVNEYIKINNAGDGNSIILKKTNTVGTFNQDYDIVFRQNGTIQLSDLLWNYTDSTFGFDQNAPYDKTLYDQTPDIELENIIKSLKGEIFTDQFSVYWNEFFFAAVKYAFSEQRFLDWAFKTSFISVQNYAGSLEQRKVYKIQNSSYLEQYIEEIKPYKTKIRNFITEYDYLENSNTYNSDFDYPTIYNELENKFDVLNIDNINGQYPWQSWKDNYSYSVDSIEILYPGAGYKSIPTLEIISAAGDIITRTARARAFISAGKIYAVEIIDSGEGYTKTPTVVINGGGDTKLIPASLYPVLYNGKVRSNNIKIKFDRISTEKLIGDKSITDTFITNGNIKTFNLSWAADTDLAKINVYFNNIKLLSSEFTLENYRAEYIDSVQTGKPYNKLYSKLTINDNILPITTASIVADTTEPVNPGDNIVYLNNTTNIVPGQRISFDGVSIGSTVVSQVTTVGFRKVIYVEPKINSFISKGTRLSFISTATGLYNEVSIKYNKNIELYSAVDRIVDYYEPNTGMPGVDVDQLMTGVSFPGTQLQTLNFSYSSNWDQLPFDSVFWEDTDNSKKLDTIIDGGNLSYSTAVGINPEDIIVSGDSFLSTKHSHSPEELLAGEVHDSLGINVYTRNLYGGGRIFNNVFDVVNVNTATSYTLTVGPTNIGSIYVSFNGVVQIYQQDFDFDFENNILHLGPKLQTGRLFVTIIDIGGLEYLSNDTVTVVNTSTATVISGSIYTDIKSTFVTVNGVTLSTATTSTAYYTVGPVSTKNKRGSVKIVNLDTGTNTISAWFFRSADQKFTQINEQLFAISDAEDGFILDHPPKNYWSQSSQAVVEVEDKNSVMRRLTPPNTVYYTVKNLQREYEIDPNRNYPPNIFDLSTLEVYKNGLILKGGIDFVLDRVNDKIIFDAGFLTNGDQISITILIDYDYFILNGVLYLNARRLQTEFGITVNAKLRVVTFSDQEYNSMQQEVFDMNEHGYYQLSRSVINDNYVWVSVDRKLLINRSDFYVQSGNIVKLDPNITFVPGAQVVITTFTSIRTSTTIGYRIFKDMLGRNHFKRLSTINTTFLTRDLNINDSEIYVNNSGILPTPNPEKAIPGVVLINGERIEYMAKNGNILSRITRATLGTGAKSSYKAGTKIIDQGPNQTIPFTEATDIRTFTSTNTTSYVISNIDFNLGANIHDQVEVYFGGRRLVKPVPSTTLRLLHDTTSTYDSGETRSYIELPAEFTITAESTSSTAILELNINYLQENKTITVVKKNSTHWYNAGVGVPTNGQSLLNANTVQAQFIKERTASLPDKYYYGTQ